MNGNMHAATFDRASRRNPAAAGSEGEVRRRKAGLLAILSEGLPTLPSHLLQLNAMLGSSPVDLKQVSAVIRSDPSLTAQLLRLCNSALFNLRRRVTRVEEAAILMGTERLRNLVFTCYLIQLSCAQLPEEQVEAFWTHSLTAASLSERVARRLNLECSDEAYLGGLLHDVGKLPLLMVAAEENTAAVWLKGDSAESLALEREYFGLDHCEVGRWLGINWNFDAELVEVIESHHRPDGARFPSGTVGVVAAADHFCEMMEAGEEHAEASADEFYRASLPRLGDSGRAAVLAMLRREYPLVRKVLENSAPLRESDDS